MPIVLEFAILKHWGFVLKMYFLLFNILPNNFEAELLCGNRRCLWLVFCPTVLQTANLAA